MARSLRGCWPRSIGLVTNTNKITQRTKHIDVKYHHVRSLIVDKVVEVEKIDTDFQKADVLTKDLGTVKFVRNRRLLLGE